MIFIEMFFRFFFVGLFSIGGGLATLPFLTSMGETTGWFTQTDISNMVAISESTPGPLGVNMATYIGYQIGSQQGEFFGILGTLIAPLGLVTPSVIIILIISKILMKFRNSKYVEFAFYGLRAASVGLIASACLGVAKIAFLNLDATGNELLSYINIKNIILSVTIFICVSKFKKIHPVFFILAAAVIGIIFQM